MWRLVGMLMTEDSEVTEQSGNGMRLLEAGDCHEPGPVMSQK